jgi:FlaG/FlaF family flagellin (archaellin)
VSVDVDERAVTPAVGTVLLVAVLVVVGAVVGAYTVGIAAEVDDGAPNAAFDVEWDQGTRTLTITYAGGDAIDEANTDRLVVSIRDDDDTGSNDYLLAETDWANRSNGAFPVDGGDEFVITGENGGGDLDVERRGTNVANPASETHEPEVDDVVRVTWYDGDESFVLVEYVIPRGED